MMAEKTEVQPLTPGNTNMTSLAPDINALTCMDDSTYDVSTVRKPPDGDVNVAPAPKRRKVSPEKDEKLKAPLFIRPALHPTIDYYDGTHYLPPAASAGLSMTTNDFRPRPLPIQRRASAVNLKNYPASPHPAGLGIWVLQKVEQMRKDRIDTAQTSFGGGTQWQSFPQYPPTSYRNYSYVSQNQMTPPILQWQVQETAQSIAAGDSSHDESDATRRQSQRDRKSKQRSENWAKNKENDVVARAKLEAKKKFPAESSEAQKQEWVEQRIKEDFERLLNRLAAQFQGEIGHLEPFKVGFADNYFHVDRWPPGYDQDTLSSGKLLADVLPGLTESRVTERSLTAATTLHAALQQIKPPTTSFFAAIRLLSENTEVIHGIDKVLTYLFSPKTGRNPSRRRSSDRSAGSTISVTISAQKGAGASGLHWKEPATPQNAFGRFSSSPPSNLPYKHPFADGDNFRDRQVKPYTAAWPGYSTYAPHPASTWPPYNYFPSTGPSNLPQYSQPNFSATECQLNPPQQISSHIPPTATPIANYFGQPAECFHPKAIGSVQAGFNTDSTAPSQMRDIMSKSLVESGNYPEHSTPPETPSGAEKHRRKTPFIGREVLDHIDPHVSIAAGAENLLSSVSEKSPSAAPASPATPDFDNTSYGSNITSPASITDADNTNGDDNFEVYDATRTRVDMSSASANENLPVPRFSSRERRPTARAISANLTPSVLSNSVQKSKKAAELPPTEKEALFVSSQADEAAINASQEKQRQTFARLEEVSLHESFAEGERRYDRESEEPTPLRSSARERKPTAKALALGTGSRARKRRAASSGTPPPSKAVKTAESVRMTTVASPSTSASASYAEVAELPARNFSKSGTSDTANEISEGSVDEVSDLVTEISSQKIVLRVSRSKLAQGRVGEGGPKGTGSLDPTAKKRDLETLPQPKMNRAKVSETLRETTSSLLALAAIAEEWSDSEDEDETTSQSEYAFKERLVNELRKFTRLEVVHQQSFKPSLYQKERAPVTQIDQVAGKKLKRARKSRREQLQGTSLASAPDLHVKPTMKDFWEVAQTSAQSPVDGPNPKDRDIFDLRSSEDSSKALQSSLVAVGSPKQMKTESDASRTKNIHARLHLKRSPSGSQVPRVGETEAALQGLRAAARNRGLVIDENMTGQLILNKISEYDVELHHVLGSKQAEAPKGNHQIQTPQETVWQVNLSTDTPPAGTATRARSSSRPASFNGTRFKINPRGLNGERSGRGTIINVHTSEDGKLGQKRAKEVGSEKDGESVEHAIPSVPATKLKGGGQLITFSQFRVC